VLGHESLGRAFDPGTSTALKKGDHVVGIVRRPDPVPQLVRSLGATYHAGTIADLGFEPDVIIECTGVGKVTQDSIGAVASGGIICLTGVGSGGIICELHVADVAAQVVLRNNVVVESVNANKRHWYKAGEALARPDRS